MLLNLVKNRRIKKTFDHPEITIIAKNINGFLKAIFLVKGEMLLIYVKELTFDDEVIVHGTGAGGDEEVFRFDFTDDFPLPGNITAVELAMFADGSSYVYLRTPQGSLDPPFGEYPLTYAKNAVTVGSHQLPNYATSAFNFRELHRGADRDIFYTADGWLYGTGTNAKVHQRLWSDATRLVSLVYALPNQNAIHYPASQLNWPPVGFDIYFPSDFAVAKNKSYVLGTISSNYAYLEIWELDPGVSFTAMLAFQNDYHGGSSIRDWGAFLFNRVDDEMAFTLSEFTNTAGAASDLELVIDVLGATIFEVSPGTLAGYTRNLTNETRISRCWKVADEVYALQVENTAQPSTGGIPDTIILYDNTGDVPETSLVFEVADKRALKKPIVDQLNPRLALIGESDRSGGGDPRSFIIDVLTRKITVVSTSSDSLTSATFVR
jgi:hypothetical protein